ncbi:MAG: guanylate kinase [SAR324 cluster bacterium]|nr:guanylate kinase [SAR324 cluster bacterium]
MTQPRVFIVSGPSGVGKSSIIHGVLDRREDVRLSVSTTTRETREEEEEGRDYYFVDKAEFERMIARDWFLEWARSYGNYYGTGRTQIEDILSQGCHALLDIDTQGALNIQKRFSGAVYIFIAPPSLSVLEERLRGRGSETPESLKRRLERAGTEIGLSHRYDHIIVNSTVESCVAGFLDILNREAAQEVNFRKIETPVEDGETAMGAVALEGGNLGARDLGQIKESDSQSRMVAFLEPEVRRALRGELEGLIQERIERVLKNDLQRIFEETLREMDPS